MGEGRRMEAGIRKVKGERNWKRKKERNGKK